MRGRGDSFGHQHELFGLLFLGLGVFLALCLLSYDPFDPSFHVLAPGKGVHNLGGVVGSYLADLLLVLVGYASYLVPVGLGGVGLSAFFRRELKATRGRVLALLLLLLLLSVLCHLRFDAIGERELPAGGLIGWGLGSLLLVSLGTTGTYLVIFLALPLLFFWTTELSVVRAIGLLRDLGKMLLRRGESLSLILVARGRRTGEALYQKVVARWHLWQKHRVPPAVVLSSPPTPPSPPLRDKVLERVVEKAVPGPRILPRADLKERRREQLELVSDKREADYQLPPLSLLESESQESFKIDEESLRLNSKLLEKKLQDYGVEGKITEIHPGPIITMYEFEPASGVKVNKIVNLEDDLALTMGGKSVRIIAPLPGKAAVGIEIPNNHRETVWLKDIIGHARFQKTDSRLTLALGKDTEGIPYVADLGKMPHLLVAGATGSGKSVSVNSMILSLLYKAGPAEVRMIMVDLKMLELSVYEGIPHLLLPVVTNPRKAAMALHWAIKEMERRYVVLAERSARNIAGYNKVVEAKDRLPYLVIVVDELADLMMTSSHEVERYITRLAQMARAAGIHLILATQRPSVDVLTGLIKANFPARISFKVSSKHDSRTIIDTVGAEHLLGSGDMLFISGGVSRLLRIHGAYVSEEEILGVVEQCKKQGKPSYLEEEVLKALEAAEEGAATGEEGEELSDGLYDQAVSLVAETRQASISLVQRRLRIGYNRAARLIERMEKEGVVGPADGAKPREVYVNSLSDQ